MPEPETNDKQPAPPPAAAKPDADDSLNPNVRPTASDYSRNGKHRKGGKTLNKMGLMIAYAVVAVFIAWIVMGIMYDPESRQKNGDDRRKGSASHYAANIIGALPRRDPKPKAQQPQTPTPLNVVAKRKEIPPLKLDNPSKPRAHNDDALAALAEYRREKVQDFAAAVRSDPDAMGQGRGVTPLDARRDSIQQELARVQQEIVAAKSLGNQAAAKAQLARLNALKTQLAAVPAVATSPIASDTTVPGFSGEGTLAELGQFGDGHTGAIRGDAVQAPQTRYVLRTGSVIPATLVGGLNSDLPGQIIGQVKTDVYDTATGKYMIIPQGSRLVGQYSSAVKYGQVRAFAVWNRIVFPDGKALDLGAFPASSGAGYSGLKDKVDNHYVRIFGSAILLSAIIAGVEYSQNQGDYEYGSNRQRMGDTMSQALGQTLGNTMADMIRRNMSISPTIEIRPGFRLNVMLVKDLEFATPYRAFDYMDEED